MPKKKEGIDIYDFFGEVEKRASKIDEENRQIRNAMLLTNGLPPSTTLEEFDRFIKKQNEYKIKGNEVVPMRPRAKHVHRCDNCGERWNCSDDCGYAYRHQCALCENDELGIENDEGEPYEWPSPKPKQVTEEDIAKRKAESEKNKARMAARIAARKEAWRKSKEKEKARKDAKRLKMEADRTAWLEKRRAAFKTHLSIKRNRIVEVDI